jgi:hypothetical protein
VLHVLAFTKASAGGLTDEDTPAVSDQVFTISNNHFIPPVPIWILLALGGGSATFTRFKISTPRLRAIAQPQFPRGVLSAAFAVQGDVNDLTKMPLKLNAIDELSALCTTAAGAVQNTVGLWVSDGNIQHPVGEPYWVHGTSSPTNLAFGWASAAITLDQTLPAGRYSVIGMRVVGATATFARLIFPTGGWRPGCLVPSSFSQNEGWYFENGYLGELGQFASVAQPLLEVFGQAAGAVTYDVYLQLLKLS